MVHAHGCSAAGTANFIVAGFGNLAYDSVIDTPVKEVLFIYELYVNLIACGLEFFVCNHIVYYFVQLGGT
jgi:uncharacterized membrane protein YvlD (DUF360 family)